MGPLQLIDRKSCVLACSSSLEERYRIGKFSILRCPSCRLVYRSPYLTSQEMQALYDSKESLGEAFPHFEGYFDCCENPETDSGTRRSYLKWLKIFEKTTVGRELLDIGCGRGLFLKLAKDRGWVTKGVDFSAENVKFAKDEYGLDVEQRDIFQEGVCGEYSFVTLWDVMEHVEDPLALLVLCRQWLRKDGTLLVALPHEDSVYNWVGKLVYRLTAGRASGLLNLLYPMEHLTYYSREAACKIFNKAGFVIEKIELENSDLERIQVSFVMKTAMRILNVLGACLRKPTRIILLAKKSAL